MSSIFSPRKSNLQGASIELAFIACPTPCKEASPSFKSSGFPLDSRRFAANLYFELFNFFNYELAVNSACAVWNSLVACFIDSAKALYISSDCCFNALPPSDGFLYVRIFCSYSL